MVEVWWVKRALLSSAVVIRDDEDDVGVGVGMEVEEETFASPGSCNNAFRSAVYEFKEEETSFDEYTRF